MFILLHREHFHRTRNLWRSFHHQFSETNQGYIYFFPGLEQRNCFCEWLQYWKILACMTLSLDCSLLCSFSEMIYCNFFLIQHSIQQYKCSHLDPNAPFTFLHHYFEKEKMLWYVLHFYYYMRFYQFLYQNEQFFNCLKLLIYINVQVKVFVNL